MKNKGKPQGMTYAQVLARKAMLQKAAMEAAENTTVELRSNIYTQRAMWLMVVSMADAFGIGPERMKRDFFPALQANADELFRMEKETDAEYAFEKLRQRAEQVSGMPVANIYEKEIMEARRRHS